jgi:hypothetical protein
MKISKRTAFLLALVLVAGFLMTGRRAAAQSKAESSSPSNLKRVEVGDAMVTGSHLKAYANLWKFTQQKPGGTAAPAGTWSDSVENIDFQGRPALKRTQIAKYDKKPIQLTFVSIFDPKTMEPFSFDYARSDNGNVRHVDFHHETVTYRHTDSTGSKPAEVTVKLDRPVFDFYGGMYGVLISALPLAEGYTTELPAFDTTRMTIDWVPVRVKGRETVECGPGKTRETWVVETPTKFYGRMTWWVTKEPPYVIKAVLEVPEKEDGSGKVAAIITYTMA